MRPGHAVRGVRAIVFAGLCVVLALLGHTFMSGRPLPIPTVLVAAGAVASLAWWLGGRRRGPVGVATTAVGVQGGLHLLFSAGQLADTLATAMPNPVGWLLRLLLRGDAGRALFVERADDLGSASGPMPAGHHHAGHHHAGHGHAETDHAATDHVVAEAASMAHSGHAIEGLNSWGMLAAHFAVALLSGLWLAWGEQATFTLLGLVRDWLVEPFRLAWLRGTPAPRPPGAVRAPAHRTLTLHTRLLRHTVISRGPPGCRAVS